MEEPNHNEANGSGAPEPQESATSASDGASEEATETEVRPGESSLIERVPGPTTR